MLSIFGQNAQMQHQPRSPKNFRGFEGLNHVDLHRFVSFNAQKVHKKISCASVRMRNIGAGASQTQTYRTLLGLSHGYASPIPTQKSGMKTKNVGDKCWVLWLVDT